MSGGMFQVIDGTKLFIGGVISLPKTDLTAANFAAQVWTEVDGYVNAGAIGDTQEIVSQGVLNRGRMLKNKGTKDAGTSDHQFLIIGNDPGQKKMNEALANNCDNFAFKIEWGSNCAAETVVTFTAASNTDTVVNWTDHGFTAGQAVVFTNSGGALPTGITGGTAYYVVATDLTTNSFKISATEGGTPVQASTAGTGTTTATAADARGTTMFAALVSSNQQQGGGNNTARLQTYTLAINSNLVEV